MDLVGASIVIVELAAAAPADRGSTDKIEQRPDNGNVHAMPVMQLCRSAMESSARTIWILGDPDREVRRDRAMSVLVEQFEQQKRFLIIAEANATSGPNPLPPDPVAMNRAHQHKQADLVQRLRDNYAISKPESFSKTIALAAGWVDEQIPAPDTPGASRRWT